MRVKLKSPKKQEMPPRPDIEHWWAVEAMIASYNHVYQVTYGTRYELHGPIGISIYDNAPVASFHYEFLALSEDPDLVLKAVHAYSIPEDRQYVLDVFHPRPSSPELKEEFTASGYEFVRTGMILGLELPTRIKSLPHAIHAATTLSQAEAANHALAREGERIHAKTLRDEHIHSFYSSVHGEAVGWTQLVTVYPEVGYINQLYVLKPHRRQGVGTALIRHVLMQARGLGLQRMVLVPSEMAMPLYRRLGYQPLVYFSVFRPAHD